ncbi:MAG: sensor histidine kinase [Eubacterium sp.]
MVYSYVSLELDAKNAEMLTMILYYVLQFAIICVVTKGKLFSKLFCPIFSLVTWLGGCLFFEVIRGLFLGFDMTIGLTYEVSLVDFITEVLMIYAFSFIFVWFIRYFQNRTKKSISYKSKLNFLFLFPITHLLFTYENFAILRMLTDEQRNIFYKDHPNSEAFLIVISLTCMVIDFSILFVADHIEKVEEKNINTQKELLKNKMEFQQIEMLKEEKKEFRKIKHDLANIITTAKGFIEIGKPEKAMSVLQGTNDNLMGLAGFSLCSNETINTIIYIKQQQAQNSGINMTAEIEENSGVLIDDYDLCRILSNIIDNALNAVYLTEEKKICHIAIGIDEQCITIKSQNSFDPEKQSKIKKSELHGNGIGIIREIASKYGGEYSARQENGIWYAETFLNNKRSANSTPPEFWLNYA